MFAIYESLWEENLFGGYSLSSFHWWIDWIIIGVAIILFGGLYFFFVFFFGRRMFKDEDKEGLKQYKSLRGKEKKEYAKSAKGPLKRVIVWKRMKPWFIPTVSVVLVIALIATPVLHATWDVLITTLSGSGVEIIDTPTSRAAAAEAENNVVTIQEEGTVLLKNKDNALPIDVKTDGAINIFGSCAYGLFYGNGGSGSFQTDGRVTSFPRTAKKLEAAMEEEGFEINQNLYNFIKNYYSSNRSSAYSVAESNYDIQCGFNKYGYSEVVPNKAPYDYEPPVSAYTTPIDALGGKTLLEDALDHSDTALFAITRRGSEDEDMNYSDFHLRDNEKACIEMLEDNFEKVIILFNVPSVFEAKFIEDEKIDAAIFMGHPGLSGTKAIAEILSGKINPSGHTVDTWPYDVKSAPSYQSFGNDTTLTHTGASSGKFTEYLEGIYVGYRYYTTRGKVDADKGYNYEDEVQFSFGYGLSYTSFEKKITKFQVDEAKGQIDIVVSVKNTGEVTGKDVIELYTHAPYHPEGGVEKAWYSLSAFEKTNDIEPGETKNYEFSLSFRDLASYSTKKELYVMESGEYEISLRDDAWHLSGNDEANARTFSLASDREFANSYQTNKEYQNLFQDVEHGPNDTPIEYLSRSDFEGTFTKTSEIDRTAVASRFPGGTSNTASGRNFTFEDNQIEEPEPVYGIDNGLTLRDMKEVPFDDPEWDDLLDQMSQADLRNIVDSGSFMTAAIDSVGKPRATDYDGPSSAFHSGTGHPSEVVVACSWNRSIAKLVGESIGREGAARGLTGWYAPGINTHRSPFGGRNFEYYSEDPLIAGEMAGNTAQGAIKYGVYTYAKHFLLNEQENSRAGVFCWASEQAIREIYARGFEIYVDYGGLGIMSSFNCVGSWWAGANKALLTDLLREEWGFHGVIITDYVSSDYMAANIGLRAGNDLWLNKPANYNASYVVSQTPHDGYILLRRAAKNILYACSRSNNVWTEEDYKAVDIDEVKKTNS